MTTPFLFVPTFSWPAAPGGLLYTYAATTTTPKATYSDAAGAVPNANPVVLDSLGSATVRLGSGSYKFVLKDSTGTTTLWTQDNYSSSFLTQADIGALLYPQTAAEAAAGVTPTNYACLPGDVHRYGVVGNGITDDSSAIQAIFNMAIAVGGRYWFDGTKTYKCNSGLTLQSNGTNAKNILIEYNNCILNFSSLTGTSIALTYGATSLANSHDTEQVTIGDVRLQGPEGVGPFAYASRSTNTVGIKLLYCLHWTINPHAIFSFYKGMQTVSSWSNLHANHHIRNCYIGLHLDQLSTVSLWDQCHFIQCSYGVVAQGVDTISNQTFEACRFETNDCHVHLDADPGAAGSAFPVRSLAFNDCYYEAATYDWFRVGMDFDETAATSVRQATNNTGKTTGIRVLGGQWSNNALTPGSGTAAFCFDSAAGINAKVTEFRFEGPISLTLRCQGRPSKSAWIETRNGFNNTDNIESFEAGEFFADLTMTSGSVTLGRNCGNIASVAHVSNGIFDITFRDAYSATAEYGVFGNGDNCVVTTSNTSASVCRVTIRDFAGVAAFTATLHIYGKGRFQ